MLLLVNVFMFICALFESRRTGQNINTTSSLRLQASSLALVEIWILSAVHTTRKPRPKASKNPPLLQIGGHTSLVTKRAERAVLPTTSVAPRPRPLREGSRHGRGPLANAMANAVFLRVSWRRKGGIHRQDRWLKTEREVQRLAGASPWQGMVPPSHSPGLSSNAGDVGFPCKQV